MHQCNAELSVQQNHAPDKEFIIGPVTSVDL